MPGEWEDPVERFTAMYLESDEVDTSGSDNGEVESDSMLPGILPSPRYIIPHLPLQQTLQYRQLPPLMNNEVSLESVRVPRVPPVKPPQITDDSSSIFFELEPERNEGTSGTSNTNVTSSESEQDESSDDSSLADSDESLAYPFDYSSNDDTDTSSEEEFPSGLVLSDQVETNFDSADDRVRMTPFKTLVKRMIKVTDDGKVMKMVKEFGKGELPEEKDLVSGFHTTFLEYKGLNTGLASTAAKDPYKFRLGKAMEGFNIAVASMKPKEKSWFLVHPDLAFGELGYSPQIPSNTTVLYHIELVDVIRSGAALNFKQLTTVEKQKFPIVQKVALSLIEHAQDLSEKKLKESIHQYLKAVQLLSNYTVLNQSQRNKINALLLKIYSNLAVCYMKDSAPNKVCKVCKAIFKLPKDSIPKIPSEVYLNYSRALCLLNEYNKAKIQLTIAKRLDPLNIDINKELKKLLVKQVEEQLRQKQHAKTGLNTGATKKSSSITLILRDISKE